jgi:uncharacterized membrane protein YadS
MREQFHTVTRWIISTMYLLLSLNALIQVAMTLLDMNTDPPALTGLQLLTGSAALIAAGTAWQRSSSAWIWSLVYGATAVLLLGSLGPILDLDRDEVYGIWLGATMLAVVAVGAAWYLRRFAAAGKARRMPPSPSAS